MSHLVQCLSIQDSDFSSEEISMLHELAGDVGFAIHSFRQESVNAKLKEERLLNYEQTILSFVKLIEQRDTYTAGHTLRVAKYCELIAKEMNLQAKDIEKLTKSAVLHDIGKLITPDSILLKPDKLTPLEYKLIQEHVSSGYEMLATIKSYEELAEIIHAHHERYDGMGYPKGLKGDEIPLLSAIMTVADAFDAMTTNRIYKPRKKIKEALKEIEELSGMQFSPKVVTFAIKALSEVEIPLDISQLPQNEIERERFVHFFNDQLIPSPTKHYTQ